MSAKQGVALRTLTLAPQPAPGSVCTWYSSGVSVLALPCATSPGQPSRRGAHFFSCPCHVHKVSPWVSVAVVRFTIDSGSHAAVRLGLLREDGGRHPAGDEGERRRLAARSNASATTGSRAQNLFCSMINVDNNAHRCNCCIVRFRICIGVGRGQRLFLPTGGKARACAYL